MQAYQVIKAKLQSIFNWINLKNWFNWINWFNWFIIKFFRHKSDLQSVISYIVIKIFIQSVSDFVSVFPSLLLSLFPFFHFSVFLSFRCSEIWIFFYLLSVILVQFLINMPVQKVMGMVFWQTIILTVDHFNSQSIQKLIISTVNHFKRRSFQQSIISKGDHFNSRSFNSWLFQQLTIVQNS